MGEPDFYAALGIATDSDDVVVQAAYKALMRKYHPDTNPSANAHARAAAINAAYAVLGNPAARGSYDFRRRGGRAKPHFEQPATPEPKGTVDRQAAEAASKEPSIAQPGPWKRVGQFVVAAVILVFVKAIFFTGGHYAAANQAYDAVSAADNAAVALDDAADSLNEAAENLAQTNTQASPAAPLIMAPPSFQPPTTLAFEDIEAGAKQLDRSLSMVGIAGAKAYSTKCHAAAQMSNDWKKYDFCASFDLAADYIDDAVAPGAGQRSAYFQFIATNAADQYAPIAANSYLLGKRLESIREAVIPAIMAIVQASAARRERLAKADIDVAEQVNSN